MLMCFGESIETPANLFPAGFFITQPQLGHRAIVHPLEDFCGQVECFGQSLLDGHRTRPQDLVAINRVLEGFEVFLCWCVRQLAFNLNGLIHRFKKGSLRDIFLNLWIRFSCFESTDRNILNERTIEWKES